MPFHQCRQCTFIVAGALVLTQCTVKEPSGTPGSLAPDFSLAVLASGPPPEANGDRPIEPTVTLRANRGRVVLLEFWATWCHPCLKLHPEIAALAERYRGRGLVTYGIVFEDSPSRALAWLRDHGGVQYPELRDDEGKAARAYGVHAIPQMFLIGADGRVLSHCWGCATVVEDFGAILDTILRPTTSETRRQ